MSRSCAVCGCFGTCHEMCPSGDVVFEPDPMSLREVADKAMSWTQQYYEQPYMGYDPPTTYLDAQIKELAEENGYTMDQVHNEMTDMYYEACEQHDANESPYGRNV